MSGNWSIVQLRKKHDLCDPENASFSKNQRSVFQKDKEKKNGGHHDQKR